MEYCTIFHLKNNIPLQKNNTRLHQNISPPSLVVFFSALEEQENFLDHQRYIVSRIQQDNRTQATKKLLSYLRSTPMHDEQRDLIISVLPWFEDCMVLPTLSCLSGLFAGAKMSPPEWEALSFCNAFSCQLLLVDNSIHRAQHHQQNTTDAYHLLSVETQRILGRIFPTNHVFWSQFYLRQNNLRRYKTHIPVHQDEVGPGLEFHYQQYYGLFLLPVDALFFRDQASHSLNYDLICQSLMSAFTGYTLGPSSHEVNSGAHFTKAMKLTQALPLNGFDEWLRSYMQPTVKT